MKSYSAVNEWIQELEIAEGLKQLLIDASLTIESTIRLGYQEVSEILQIDLYVGKLIVEAAQSVMQKRYARTKISHL
jgi:ribosomal protein S8